MTDFQFLQNPFSHQWTVLAPRRAKRPDEGVGKIPACPFCDSGSADETEVYRFPENAPAWSVRVLTNKYPFAPIHEVIVHSQDHHKNFDELPLDQVEDIFRVFRERYNEHKDKGSVVLFHNHGLESGESLSHPHSQLVVASKAVSLDVSPIGIVDNKAIETEHFTIFCPETSQWPDEVWVGAKNHEQTFGDMSDNTLKDFSHIVQGLVSIFDIRHGYEFPFNFYISPWKQWYLRLIPRIKRLGGFELATNVYVNTQDPKETAAFITQHFSHPDKEKIQRENRARYHTSV